MEIIISMLMLFDTMPIFVLRKLNEIQCALQLFCLLIAPTILYYCDEVIGRGKGLQKAVGTTVLKFFQERTHGP